MNAAVKGAALAAAVAAMFGTGCGPAQSTPTTVKCQGVNECAGKGACAGVAADGGAATCAGQNACKGQGWIETASAADCTTKGGTVLK